MFLWKIIGSLITSYKDHIRLVFKRSSQLIFTCSKSTIETPEKSLKVDFEQVTISWVREWTS